VVFDIVPVQPTVTELLKIMLLVLTSKPAVGPTNMLAVMFDPDTIKLVGADGVP
jgi:hypothetical protein